MKIWRGNSHCFPHIQCKFQFTFSIHVWVVHISKKRNSVSWIIARKFEMVGRQREISSPCLVTLAVLVFIPILTAHGSKMAVFCFVAPRSLVEVYQCFRGPSCLHHVRREAARTSETLVNFYQTTQRYNPEDSHLRTHRRENLKTYLAHG
jgi:hypothetical protein